MIPLFAFRTGAALVLASISAPCSALMNGREAKATNDNLRCAALIGAADKLMTDGQIAADQDFLKRALAGAMLHLNRWAISRRISEPEAFAAVIAERDRLLASDRSEAIVAKARDCLKQVR